jgi:hypothetical protein
VTLTPTIIAIIGVVPYLPGENVKSYDDTYVGAGEGFGRLPGAGWLVEERNLVLATQLQQQS